jgi:hypothetical protein
MAEPVAELGSNTVPVAGGAGVIAILVPVTAPPYVLPTSITLDEVPVADIPPDAFVNKLLTPNKSAPFQLPVF